MFFITVLLIIALLGLIVTIGLIIAGLLNFIKDGKRAARMAVPVKDSFVEIVNTGKGIGQKGQIRYNGYVKHGKRIYKSVKETSDELTAVTKTIDIEETKNSFQQAVSSINAAQEALAAAKAVAELLAKKTSRRDGSG